MKRYLVWNVESNNEELFTHRKLIARKYHKSPSHDVYELSGNASSIDNLYNELVNVLSDRKDPPWDRVKRYVPVPIIRKRTEEHNAKISKKMCGRTLTEEHKTNISDAMKGNINRG